MSDENEDRFRNLIGGGFGQVEAAVGQELYQSQVEANKASTAAHIKHTEMMETQRQYGMSQAVIDAEYTKIKTHLLSVFALVVAVFAFLLFFGGMAFVVQEWMKVF